MKLLLLPRYDRLGASSRLRMMQYLPWLKSAGIEVDVEPLFSDAYVSGLQRNRRNMGEVVRAYAVRIRTLLGSGNYDLIWIEKELLPWMPAWLEFVLLSQSVPYALDYDDAVFHYYDRHHNPLVRSMLGSKHPALMRKAALVIAGNAYLADFVYHAGAKRVEIIPTVIDLERYPEPANMLERDQFLPPYVGWIGQRATAAYLQPYKQIFHHLSAEGSACFSAIGIDAHSLGLPMKSLPWSESTEVATIAGFDIGIMPLLDDPFERGKCGYKLVQYMACGLPVVASPVGVNCQLIEHGVNGFLAETTEEWEDALRILIADKELRQRMGLAGRKKVEEHFTIQGTGPKVAALLKDSVINKG